MSLTSLAFVVAYATGLLRAFMVHPSWGLYTYIGVFYLHPPFRWWGASLPDLRWSFSAALVTLLAIVTAKLPPNSVPWTSNTLFKLIIAYVVWMWIQTPWANPDHFEGLILMTKYVVLLYIVYRLVVDEKGLVAFAFAHVLGCFYFGWLALDAVGEGRLEYVGGPGVYDSNTLGMHVSTGLFFAGALILSQRGWMRWVVIATVPFLANCVVQTESRGAFLGAACGGLAFYWLAPKLQRKHIVWLGTLAVFVLLAYAPATYWERMGTIQSAATQNEEIDNSAESRLVIIAAQWEMFKDHPFGLGFNTTAYLSRAYLDTRWLTAASGQDIETQGARSSHNTIMSVVVDQGIPGMILAGFIGLSLLGMVRRLKKLDLGRTHPTLALMSAAIVASLIAIFVSGQFTNYLKAEVLVWIAALLTAGLHLAQKATSSSRVAKDFDINARTRGERDAPFRASGPSSTKLR